MDKWVEQKLKEWEEQGLTPQAVLEAWETQQREAHQNSHHAWLAQKGEAWKKQYYAPGGGYHQLRARTKVKTIREKQRQVRSLADKAKKERNPLRTQAQTAVKNAIRDGLLTRPTACSLPVPLDGSHGGRIEADHYLGYAPEHHLEVQWTCRRCHVFLEKQRRGDTYGRHNSNGA